MTAPDDPGILAKVTVGLGAALTALGTWAWHHTHARIKDTETKMDSKASSDEVDRHRDHISKLFDKVQELSDKTDLRFAAVEARASDRHVELLNAIHSMGRDK